jgi:hypothetical protein
MRTHTHALAGWRALSRGFPISFAHGCWSVCTYTHSFVRAWHGMACHGMCAWHVCIAWRCGLCVCTDSEMGKTHWRASCACISPQVCVRACARGCARVRTGARGCAWGCACGCACGCVCMCAIHQHITINTTCCQATDPVTHLPTACPLKLGGTGNGGCQPPALISTLIDIVLSPGVVAEPIFEGAGGSHHAMRGAVQYVIAAWCVVVWCIAQWHTIAQT